MKKRLIIYSLIILLLFTVGSVYVYCEFKAKREKEAVARVILAARRSAWHALAVQLNSTVKGASGVEPGIIVADLSTGWRIEINPDRLFPSASLAKVPIMASCFFAAAENRLDLNKQVKLSRRDKVSGSGVMKNLPDGSVFRVNELMSLMVAQSDNTASNLLIECLGQKYLNDTFRRMGLKSTNLSRKMMDFRSRKEGRENYTSPRDIAFLLEKIYYGKLINREYSQRCLSLLKAQKIRDRIPAKLPAGTLVAHKTGLEYGVCHDAGIIFISQGDFLICVLTRHSYKNSYPAKRFIARVASQVYNFYVQSMPEAR
jgi:beta-lactamase class A